MADQALFDTYKILSHSFELFLSDLTNLQLNTGQFGDQYKNRDLKIEKVWIQGLTGCNVTVGVVDDGV